MATRILTIYRPGTVAYDEAFRFQRSRVDDLARAPRDEGTLILLEHPPVVTIGRSGSRENILASAGELEREGVTVREANRGGDVTYHGPGQIVGYPILPLAFHGRDVHAYLRRIEAFLIRTLQEYGIAAARKPGFTGVWTPDGKIASIGVAVSHWIGYHGFALNVAPNLDHFNLIRPCGIEGVRIASMQDLMDRTPDLSDVADRLIANFCAEFGFDEQRRLPWRAPEEDDG